MAIAKEQVRQIISENNLTNVGDVYSLLRDSFKDILQELMEAELDASLGYEKNHKGDVETTNKRNGHSTKTIKSQYGEFPLAIPRDREGAFEPQLIPKHQRDVSGIEEKVISLYSRGLSTRDIHDQIQDLYGIEMAAEMAALAELDLLKEKWGKKYPYAISNWENNWQDVSSFFQFSGDIRRIMYTTYTDIGIS